jgi:AraC-like DNA-binding protein
MRLGYTASGISMAAAFAPFSFSAEGVADRDRLTVCRAQLSGLLSLLDLEPIANIPLEVRTLSCALPGASLASCFLKCARACRRQSHCRDDGSDDIMLLRPVGGTVTVEQNGRCLRVAAGDAIVISTSRPWEWELRDTERLDCLRVPRLVATSAPTDLVELLPFMISRDTPAFQLLAHYGGALLQGSLPLGTADTQRMAAHHLQDLLSLLLKAENQNGGLSRLDAMKLHIVRNLRHSTLCVEDVAHRHGISARTLQKMFEGEGTTFSEFVLSARLAAALKDMLSDGPQRKISEIAFEAGFGDLSYFNRTFRQRYGMTPSRARAGGAGAVDRLSPGT